MSEKVVALDVRELAVRIAEACIEIKRPAGSADEVLAVLGDDESEAWMRAARAAADYFIEITGSIRVQ